MVEKDHLSHSLWRFSTLGSEGEHVIACRSYKIIQNHGQNQYCHIIFISSMTGVYVYNILFFMLCV